jgi:clan AA aspartic protease (TIGR02281 family)
MRSWLTLVVGVLIGPWLAFSGTSSPAGIHALGMLALERHDYSEAARIWSRAVTMQPDNPTSHYLRATSLARLGHASSAIDAYQQTLLLEPPEALAKLANEGLSELATVRGSGAETTVSLEPVRGVWIVRVSLNGGPAARFRVDTGASVTLIAPALARSLGLEAAGGASSTALQTVAGQTSGAAATIRSVQVGAVEARDVPVVIHEPGLDVDGILGNSFLGRFAVTLDADLRLLHLRPTRS